MVQHASGALWYSSVLAVPIPYQKQWQAFLLEGFISILLLQAFHHGQNSLLASWLWFLEGTKVAGIELCLKFNQHETPDDCRLPWNLSVQERTESGWMKGWDVQKVKNCKLVTTNLTPQPNAHKHEPIADQKEEFKMMSQYCMKNVNGQHI